MNTINNFDISSSGLGIELSAFYDTNLSYHYFHDNFIKDGDALIYTDYGNLPRGWKKEANNFTTETVTGYSQGDVVEVIIPEELRDILGVPEGKDIVSNEHLEHLIYGCPFSAILVIDGVELYLDEILNDQFVWDKQKVLSGLPSHLKSYTEDQQKIIMDFCESNLPEYLDYR